MRPAATVVFALIAGALSTSCGSEPVSQPPPPPAGSLVASDPAPASLLLASAVNLDVAYITLPPGSAPTGALATLRNVRTGDTVAVIVGAGGFDPTPIAAIAGDAIVAVIRDESFNVVLQLNLVVPSRRRPSVVRTYPPAGKRDVPLNSRISVVFSEPVVATTVTDALVTLRRGTSVVSGHLEFRDSSHVAVVFVPTDPLAPTTDYTVEIAQTVRDLDGEPLENPVTVEFTTGVSAEFAQYRVVIISPPGGDISQVGDTVVVHLGTQAIDANDAGIEGAVVRLRVSPGTVVPDTTTTGLNGLTNVVWKFAGTAFGGSETAQLTTCASNSATRCDVYRPLLTFPYGPRP